MALIQTTRTHGLCWHGTATSATTVGSVVSAYTYEEARLPDNKALRSSASSSSVRSVTAGAGSTAFSSAGVTQAWSYSRSSFNWTHSGGTKSEIGITRVASWTDSGLASYSFTVETHVTNATTTSASSTTASGQEAVTGGTVTWSHTTHSTTTSSATALKGTTTQTTTRTVPAGATAGTSAATETITRTTSAVVATSQAVTTLVVDTTTMLGLHKFWTSLVPVSLATRSERLFVKTADVTGPMIAAASEGMVETASADLTQGTSSWKTQTQDAEVLQTVTVNSFASLGPGTSVTTLTVTAGSATVGTTTVTARIDPGSYTTTRTVAGLRTAATQTTWFWATTTAAETCLMNDTANGSAVETTAQATKRVLTSAVRTDTVEALFNLAFVNSMANTMVFPVWEFVAESTVSMGATARVSSAFQSGGYRASTDTALTETRGSSTTHGTTGGTTEYTVNPSSVRMVAGESVSIVGTVNSDRISVAQVAKTAASVTLAPGHGVNESRVVRSVLVGAHNEAACKATLRDATGGTTATALQPFDVVSAGERVMILETVFGRSAGGGVGNATADTVGFATMGTMR